MLSRKIISTSVSSTLFAVLFAMIVPNPFQEVTTVQSYFHSASMSIGLYLMYSFPVILTYGVLTSIISDKVAGFMLKKSKNEYIELIVSGIFHIVFGLALLHIGVMAAVLFFVTDRLLKKQNKKFSLLHVVMSFAIPTTLELLYWGNIYIQSI